MPTDSRMASVHLAMPSRLALKAFNRRRVVDESHDHLAERPFWGPHPDVAIARIEQPFFEVGQDYLRALYAAVLGWKTSKVRPLTKAFHVDPGQIDGWGKLADLFNSKLPATQLMDGWGQVVQKLSGVLLPQATIEAAAQRMALESSLLWRLGQRVIHPIEMPWEKAEKALSPAQAASMEWAKVHGMFYLQKLDDEAKLALREILVQSKEAHEGITGLERRLFDKMSGLNRDWRRIALTETGMAVTNGQLASVPAGIKHIARWIASPMACPHCLKYAAQVFEVLQEPDLAKGQTALWPGKNNVGRSAYHWSHKLGRYRDSTEMYWPCQPLHPNCACSFVISPAP